MGAPAAATDQPAGAQKRRRRTTVLKSVVLLLAGAIALLVGLPSVGLLAPLQSYYSLYQQPAAVVMDSSSSSNGRSSSSSDSGSRSGGGDGGGGSDTTADPPPPLELEVELPPGFRFHKVVAIVAYDRFEYFRQVVDALRQAWGSEAYTLAITVDGPPRKGDTDKLAKFDRHGWENIVAYSRQLQWLSTHGHGFARVLVNTSATNLGLWANKKKAADGALRLSDWAVVLEDDVTLERDGLRWFEWHVTSGLIFRRPDIAVATCWGASFPYLPTAAEAHDLLAVQELGLLDKYWLDHWATPWGWATWRRTWDALGADWTGQDSALGEAVAARGWSETMPLVPRCNNIGSVGAHRAGRAVGHIHQRAVTSAPFRALHACQYAELPRANASDHLTFEPLYRLVRQGIERDGRAEGPANQTLAAYRQQLRRYVAAQPDPGLFRSSC